MRAAIPGLPAVVLLALLVTPSAAAAPHAPLQMPKSEPILVITGKITNTNFREVARFDRGMLEEIGTVKLVTGTPWHDGPVEFEGVLMSKLMDVVGADGTEVLVTALDDYRSTIPMADFERYAVVLALRRDGRLMPIRDKGPLFIVYPFDSDEALRNDVYYGRAVWQVMQLTVQ